MSSSENKHIPKPLGFWMTTSLVTGNMIGSGVYLLPVNLAAFGGVSIFGWIVSSLGAILLALIFARLGRLYPKTGGPYAFVHEVFGDFMGFEIAWTYWISVWIGNAAIVIGLVSYLSYFFPTLNESDLISFATTLGFLWLFTAINLLGIKFAGLVQLVTSILKLIPLFLLGFLGIFYIDFTHFHPFNLSNTTNSTAVMTVASLTLWSFIGLESGTIPAEHVHNPKRTIPLATIIGTVVASIVYILSSIAVLGIIAPQQLIDSTAPYVDAAEKLWGPTAAIIVAISAIISSMGALNGWILVQGQVPRAAAKDRLFPPIFGRLSKKNVPALGLIISSILVSIFLSFNFREAFGDQFMFLILLATLNMLLPYVFCSMGAIYLFLSKKKDFSKPSLIFHIIIACLGFAFALWAILGSGEKMVFYGFFVLLLGIPVFILVKIYNQKLPPNNQ